MCSFSDSFLSGGVRFRTVELNFMTNINYYIHSLTSFIIFNRAFQAIFCRFQGLSPFGGYLILFLVNNPSSTLILRDALSAHYNNTLYELTKLLRRGYVIRSGDLWYLTGKGEMVYHSFTEFCRQRGVILGENLADNP